MKILETLKDVFKSSLPLLVVIIIVNIISPMSVEGLVKVAVGYFLVVLGQTLFLMGLESSIVPIGKLVGNSLIKLKKPAFIIMFGLLFGVLATVAEPALSVLATQVNSINTDINHTFFLWLLGSGIGVGVGFSLYRVMKDLNIKIVFFVIYILIFIVVFFVPEQYRALAFDASGATTGDVSVPFILALGVGVSTTMSKSKTNDESFGIIGIASVGPIIAVFIYGLILGNNNSLNPYTAGQSETILSITLNNLSGVALAIIPIIIVFLIFQFIFLKLPKKRIIGLLLGSLVVYVGLFVFLFGIDLGFAFAGKHIGDSFTNPLRPGWFKWILLVVCFILGFAITLTEPGVTVLAEQVEEVTNGHISKKIIRITLAIGIGFAGLLSILKILIDVNILWLLVPLYVIALVLLFVTPKLFVGLAYDSGGVSGGAITSAFLTPLTLGVSQTLGQEILTSGFGMIAFISVTPLIAIQILGIIYNIKIKSMENNEVSMSNELGQFIINNPEFENVIVGHNTLEESNE